jgi:hypothetical protein
MAFNSEAIFLNFEGKPKNRYQGNDSASLLGQIGPFHRGPSPCIDRYSALNLLQSGGHKETSSILADQWRPHIRAQMRGGGVAGPHTAKKIRYMYSQK